jgi:predicted transposase/invertase (TIGR01784 family)
MVPGIDPKVDYAFKRLFGREENRALLIHLIDSVLKPDPGAEITDIQILNPFNEKETPDDKWSVLDIKARDGRGRQFNVEMQMLVSRLFTRRVLYYWSRLHQQQLREGQDYAALRPTISISFVNGVLFPEVPDYHLSFRLFDQTHQAVFSDDIALHLIELPKFVRPADHLTDRLDIWAYFFRHAESLDTDALPGGLNVSPIRNALEELRMLTQDERERQRYEDRLKAQRDAISFIKEVAALQAEVDAKRAAVDAERVAVDTERVAVDAERADIQAKGEKIGTIHLCQRRLNRPLTPAEQLAALSPDELTRLAEQLEAELFR